MSIAVRIAIGLASGGSKTPWGNPGKTLSLAYACINHSLDTIMLIIHKAERNCGKTLSLDNSRLDHLGCLAHSSSTDSDIHSGVWARTSMPFPRSNLIPC
jgi:hypothetical protein